MTAGEQNRRLNTLCSDAVGRGCSVGGLCSLNSHHFASIYFGRVSAKYVPHMFDIRRILEYAHVMRQAPSSVVIFGSVSKPSERGVKPGDDWTTQSNDDPRISNAGRKKLRQSH